MVLIGLIIAVVLIGLWVGFKTDPFNYMGAGGAWAIGALVSVIALGMLSWHSYPVEKEFEVYDVIDLTYGIALHTDKGNKYVRSSVTHITDECDEASLKEISNKSYPYLLTFSVTTSTHYELCLPADDRT